jgi:hypothetical protein
VGRGEKGGASDLRREESHKRNLEKRKRVVITLWFKEEWGIKIV